MAAQTYDVQRPARGFKGDETELLPLQGATAHGGAYDVWKGQPVAQDVSVLDGYYTGVGTGVTWASGDVFGGIAIEHQHVPTGLADGGKRVTVARDGTWGFPVGNLTQASVGAAAYLTDDNTVTVTSTDALWIGYIVDVSNGYVWVDIEKAAGLPNTAT